MLYKSIHQILCVYTIYMFLNYFLFSYISMNFKAPSENKSWVRHCLTLCFTNILTLLMKTSRTIILKIFKTLIFVICFIYLNSFFTFGSLAYKSVYYNNIFYVYFLTCTFFRLILRWQCGSWVTIILIV